MVVSLEGVCLIAHLPRLQTHFLQELHWKNSFIAIKKKFPGPNPGKGEKARPDLEQKSSIVQRLALSLL